MSQLHSVEGSESDPQDEHHSAREGLIDEAITLFGPRSGRPLGREEARHLIERLTAFFSLLAEWDRVERGEVDREIAA